MATVRDIDFAAMDAAAANAIADLKAEVSEVLHDPEALTVFIRWWARWYREVGYRRLGKALVACALQPDGG